MIDEVKKHVRPFHGIVGRLALQIRQASLTFCNQRLEAVAENLPTQFEGDDQ